MTNSHRKKRKIKAYIVNRCILGAAIIAIALAIVIACVATSVSGTDDHTESATETAERAPTPSAAANTTPPQTAQETPTSTPHEVEDPAPFFELTDEERKLIEQVVAAEARGEPYEGQMAVAQCILTACQKDGIRPEEAIKKYKYTTARATPTWSVMVAVSSVFDNGEFVTDEPIIYFYNPALTTSAFHERQIFVIEIGNHKFFKEA